jgi:TPR repeat protein
MFRIFLSVVILGFAGTLNASAADRIALVIGNASYAHTKTLANPLNDANDIATLLGKLNFTVIKVLDGDFGNMRSAIRSFNAQADSAKIAVVYYAGHGMELGGENWLIPTDAQLKTDLDIANEAISLGALQQSVGRASDLGLIILDSCRDNPFARMTRTKLTRSVDRGLARIEPVSNVLVAYAAKDGTTATDGDGRNSPYSAALLKHLATPGLDVGFAFRRVRDDVMRATDKRQQPFVYGSLSRNAIYLAAPDAAAATATTVSVQPVAPPQPPASKAEDSVWDTIRGSNDERLFENFVAQFPNSLHVSDARTRLEAVRSGGECDRLTAQLLRSVGTKGDAAEPIKLESQSVKTACESAISRSPDVARYALQGARAAEAAGDYPGARDLYTKAADLGSGIAMVSLGVLYETGHLGPADFAKAQATYEMAYTMGEAKAATRIGMLHELGRGVRKNRAEAARWFRDGARLGDPVAMTRLARLLEEGLGVRKDVAEARTWRRKAEAAQQPEQPPSRLSNDTERGRPANR